MQNAHSQMLTAERDAMDWTARHFSISSYECIRDFPWSKVYRIENGDSTAFLKIVPPGISHTTRSAPLLAQQFPDVVPGVIAADTRLGLVLTRNHGGTQYEYDPSDDQLRELITTYGRMQAKAKSLGELTAGLPQADMSTLVSQLLAFLSPGNVPDNVPGALVGVEYFIGDKSARRYHQALSKRAHLLEDIIATADELPLTVNHGDLRPRNAARTDDRGIVIYDWDDAFAGPAGLSLHGLFSGCSMPVKLLAGDDLGNRDKARTKGSLLDDYIDTLERGGYADRAALTRSLPGSACAGVILYLLGYSRYPRDDKRFKKNIGGILTNRLSDLLDLCDFLALNQREHVLAFADDYRRHHRAHRAEHLLRRYIWRAPNDLDAYLELATLLRQRGRHEDLQATCQQALEIDPDNVYAHTLAGAMYTETMRYDEAIAHLRHASRLAAEDTTIARRLESAFELKKAMIEAERPDVVPRLQVSPREFERQKISPAKLALAVSLFKKHGVLALENVFDTDLIKRCCAQYMNEYGKYFENRRHEDALRIGDKRFQVTMEISGEFNSPGFYGNPIMLSLFRRLLGDKFVFGSVTASTSLPGAKEQWSHKDHSALFADEDWEVRRTPVFAIAMMVPLVDLNDTVGTTKVKKGSHLKSMAESEKMRSQAPFVDAGSCYLMDYRLSHRGQANRSDTVRPVLNTLYHRRWFKDALNFKNQPTVRLRRSEFQRIPDDLKPLFAWALEPRPEILED